MTLYGQSAVGLSKDLAIKFSDSVSSYLANLNLGIIQRVNQGIYRRTYSKNTMRIMAKRTSRLDPHGNILISEAVTQHRRESKVILQKTQSIRQIKICA